MLDDKGNAVGPPTTSLEIGRYLEDSLPLVYGVEASPLFSVNKASVKERTPSSSSTTNGTQSKKVIRTPCDAECVKVRVESLATV